MKSVSTIRRTNKINITGSAAERIADIAVWAKAERKILIAVVQDDPDRTNIFSVRVLESGEEMSRLVDYELDVSYGGRISIVDWSLVLEWKRKAQTLGDMERAGEIPAAVGAA